MWYCLLCCKVGQTFAPTNEITMCMDETLNLLKSNQALFESPLKSFERGRHILFLFEISYPDKMFCFPLTLFP